MSKEIILGTDTYILNQEGDSPTWGEQLSTLVEAIVDNVNNLTGPYDTLNNLFLFNNSTTANLVGAEVDPAAVNGAILTYSARRVTSSVTATEVGQLTLTYNSSNATSAKFDVSQFKAGSAGIEFSILDSGTINLSSNSIAGTGHIGRLRYSIRAFEI